MEIAGAVSERVNNIGGTKAEHEPTPVLAHRRNGQLLSATSAMYVLAEAGDLLGRQRLFNDPQTDLPKAHFD